MTVPTRPRPLRGLALALAASLWLALPIALAATPSVSAAEVPFADGVDRAGVDLGGDDGLLLVLGAAGEGTLGDALVPDYDTATLPTDALGRVVVPAALDASGIVTSLADGLAFVMADVVDVDATVAAFARRLAELGWSVDHHVGERAFGFERDGLAYRAVFGVSEAGMRVYLGF